MSVMKSVALKEHMTEHQKGNKKELPMALLTDRQRVSLMDPKMANHSDSH